MSDDRLIYLDNAATTQMHEEVFEAMKPYFLSEYGNPSSIYRFAAHSAEAVDRARTQIAEVIGANPREIYFTAGGSESDNWALKSVAAMYASRGKHIIVSQIEHHAILHTAEYLEKNGFDITYLEVDKEGRISLDALERAIRPDTILISIMAANNEIGTIQPIAEIGRIAHKHQVLFHTDAVQAFGHISIDVNEMNIDLLSASGHKIGGPKGVGFLYVKKGTKIGSFIHGGAQERKKRAGTLNVPGIVGMGKAAEIALHHMKADSKTTAELRDYAIDRILAEIPYSRLNGHRKDRLPNNINICFRFIEGESLLIMLDAYGICASSGSACTSGSLDPSHVLLAIGLPHEIAHGSLRLSLSTKNTKEEIDYTVDRLKEIIARLRSMSPLYEDFIADQKH